MADRARFSHDLIHRCVGVWQNDRVEIIANDRESACFFSFHSSTLELLTTCLYTNLEGNRTTPSYVAFSSEERLIGDAAKNQAAMNPTNSEPGAKRALDNTTNISSV
jgi:molecular chaperone DnaK (HSP70)